MNNSPLHIFLIILMIVRYHLNSQAILVGNGHKCVKTRLDSI